MSEQRFTITHGEAGNQIKIKTSDFSSEGTRTNNHGAAKVALWISGGGKTELDAKLSLHAELQDIRDDIEAAIEKIREEIDL